MNHGDLFTNQYVYMYTVLRNCVGGVDSVLLVQVCVCMPFVGI